MNIYIYIKHLNNERKNINNVGIDEPTLFIFYLKESISLDLLRKQVNNDQKRKNIKEDKLNGYR